MVLAALVAAVLAAVELVEAGSRADLKSLVKQKKSILQYKKPIQFIFESAFYINNLF